jgi:hypothetical protein
MLPHSTPLWGRSGEQSAQIGSKICSWWGAKLFPIKSKEERDNLWAKVQAVDERAGAKWVIVCNSRWADESIYDWGVLEYPSMEAYQQKVKELEELEWWRYFSAKTILGTKMEI